MTRISTDTKLTNVVGLPGNQPPFQTDHLDGVQADLKDVVDESQQGGEGERCHEYGGETELDHWRGWTVRQTDSKTYWWQFYTLFIEQTTVRSLSRTTDWLLLMLGLLWDGSIP